MAEEEADVPVGLGELGDATLGFAANVPPNGPLAGL